VCDQLIINIIVVVMCGTLANLRDACRREEAQLGATSLVNIRSLAC